MQRKGTPKRAASHNKTRSTSASPETGSARSKEKPAVNVPKMVLGYLAVLLLLLATAPLMTYCLYDWSLEFIRSLKPYQTDTLTAVMNFFSAVGDGEIFFYMNVVFLLLGDIKAFTYNSTTCAFAQHFLNWLKLQFHSSRPQFDDNSLGIVN